MIMKKKLIISEELLKIEYYKIGKKNNNDI